MKQSSDKTLTLKTLTKSNVWDVQENDIFRLWEGAEKDADINDNVRHYMDIIRSAFSIEEVLVDRPEVIKKYEDRGCHVGMIKVDDVQKKYAIKKKPIPRVTDLTYENIHHITAAKLIEVLERNFGGGWESLSQSIRDIIESGFDISTTTLPKDRLKKPGGMYEKKLADDFEVLEIPKGSWVEAIFAKAKPIVERPKTKFSIDDEDDEHGSDLDNEDEDLPEVEDDYNKMDDDEDEYDEDKLTEESYRTTFDTTPEDLELAEDVVDDDY